MIGRVEDRLKRRSGKAGNEVFEEGVVDLGGRFNTDPAAESLKYAARLWPADEYSDR